LTIVLDLCLQIANPNFIGPQQRSIALHHLHHRGQMRPGIAQCAFTISSGGLQFLLPQTERLRPQCVFRFDLRQMFARSTVVVFGGLSGQREGALPDPVGQIRYFTGQPGEGGGIAFGARPDHAKSAPVN
jgi:hypothetical protein